VAAVTTESEPNYPDFDDAIREFAAFAQREGFSERLVFVSGRDVVVRGSSLAIRTPNQVRARALAAAVYAAAVRRDLGVLVGALCSLQGRTCVFVGAPVDEDERGRLMYPRGLKMSVPQNPRPGVAIAWPLLMLLKLSESREKRSLKMWLFK
jgi:hypothetical protein